MTKTEKFPLSQNPEDSDDVRVRTADLHDKHFKGSQRATHFSDKLHAAFEANNIADISHFAGRLASQNATNRHVMARGRAFAAVHSDELHQAALEDAAAEGVHIKIQQQAGQAQEIPVQVAAHNVHA